MNLYDMARRDDPNLEVVARQGPGCPESEKDPRDDFVSLTKRRVGSEIYRGFHIVARREACVLRIKELLTAFPFCSGERFTGWSLLSLSDKPEGTVVIRTVLAGVELARSECSVGLGSATPILLPMGLGIKLGVPADVEICVGRTSASGIFLIDHRVMDRRPLLDLCKGSGVEIGPGTNPQVKPSDEVEVTYLEQSPAENWSRLYAKGNDIQSSHWEHYQIGDAHNIPSPDGSLNFIFSSHVFEHLVNPIGHLRYWRTKLLPGGKLVAVIPTVTGCKDYVHMPCDFSDLLGEDSRDLWEAELPHYERWVRIRKSSVSAAELFKVRRSIHVHFYETRNISKLFSYAVESLGYEWFSIDYEMNHKDMHCVVSA